MTVTAHPESGSRRAELAAVLADEPPAFALLHRPQSSADTVQLLVGEELVVPRLADLPLPPPRPEVDGPDLLALIPYRQIAERGLACHDDGAPLVALRIQARAELSLGQVLRKLPDEPAVLAGRRFDLDDEEYADVTRRIVADEIGRGEGSNFVIRRTFTATVVNHSVRTALSVFRRLLLREPGAHCTFIVRCAGRTLVGATPERLISVRDGAAVMNPLSGTYRYPPDGPTVADLLRFLADRKEAEELYMVVDEELKMMSRLCERGGRLVGPQLTAMGQLAHTGYLITGHTSLDVRDVLRSTMFAPTVTGSPLESACRVITRYERRGRGYYGGALALIGQHDGRRTLDASILIRTAEIDPGGRLEIGVGSTLVRHSDPASEVAETRAKASALLAAFDGGARDVAACPSTAGRAAAPTLTRDRRVRRALAARNDGIARFWLDPQSLRGLQTTLDGRRVLVIDVEDDFTAMLADQIRALGPSVTIRGVRDRLRPATHDLVVVGPGPGDPRDLTDPRIAAVHELTRGLLHRRRPFLSVCLGHQVLCAVLGLPLARRSGPAQGTQRRIDFFGHLERVGFYNTFAAYAGADMIGSELTGGPVEVCRESDTGEVHGLRAPLLRSVQFHPESVLTENGPDLLRGLLGGLLAEPRADRSDSSRRHRTGGLRDRPR